MHVDYGQRRATENSLRLCLFVAKFVIWAWDGKREAVCSPQAVRALRMRIRSLRGKLESLSLRLWYPLDQ